MHYLDCLYFISWNDFVKKKKKKNINVESIKWIE